MTHLPVLWLDKESTKSRLVLLSNVCEGKPYSLGYNQTITSVPSLNNNLSTALIQLGFDKEVLTFVIVKTFSQIGLKDFDSKQQCFLLFNVVR